MAFNTSPTASRNNVVNTGDDSWKSQAFLNMYMTLPDGSRRKVGAVGFKTSKAFEKAVIDRLNEGGDEALKAFVNKLEFDFQMADKVVPVTDLGF